MNRFVKPKKKDKPSEGFLGSILEVNEGITRPPPRSLVSSQKGGKEKDKKKIVDGRHRHQQNILRTFLRIQPPCRVSLLISALSYRSLGRAQSNRTVINNQGKKKKKKTGVYVIRAFEILLSLLFSARRRRRREFIYFSEFCCRRKKKKKGGKRKS
jgi:hypothetical protein